ncbi:MAG: M16 family metallopeptidase, partial [Minisyncoccia bacterium]
MISEDFYTMTNFASQFTESKIEKGPLSGARIFVAPFPSPGVVSVVGSVAGGERAADVLHVSRELSSVHAAMLMEGTRNKKKRDIQLALDALGAELSFGASADRLQFAARASAHSVPKLLALVAEMLAQPAFPARELAAFKARSLAQLTLAAEDPRTQAGILLARALYPTGHLNFAETIEESRAALRAITAADLCRYQAKTTSAGTLILAATGDLDPKIFSREAQKQFSKLPRSSYQGSTFVNTEAGPLRQRASK